MSESLDFNTVCLNTVYSLPKLSEFINNIKVIENFRKCKQNCKFSANHTVVPKELQEVFDLESPKTPNGDYIVHHSPLCVASVYRFAELQRMASSIQSTFNMINESTGPLGTTYEACDNYISSCASFDYGHHARLNFISTIRWVLAQYLHVIYCNIKLTESSIPFTNDVQNIAVSLTCENVTEKLRQNKMSKLADHIMTILS